MRINLQHLNLRTNDALDRWVEEALLDLGETRQIDVANVRLERLAESSPPFVVAIHLVTPGPDVFTRCQDHTLRAAFNKALDQLRQTVTQRATKRSGKTPGLRRTPATARAVRSRAPRNLAKA